MEILVLSDQFCLLLYYIYNCTVRLYRRAHLPVHLESVQTESLLFSELLQLALGGAINHDILVLDSILDSLGGLSSGQSEQQDHDTTRYDTGAHHTYHDQVALSVFVRALGIGGPSGVQSVSGQNRSKIAETGNQSRGCGDTDFTMARLEDRCAHCHDSRNSRAETEANDQKTSVSRPAIVATSEGGSEKTSQDDETGETEDDVAMSVEAIAERGDEEDGNEIHDPDWCEEKRQVDTAQAGIDGMNNDSTITLNTNTW